MSCNLPSEMKYPKEALKHLLQLETIGVVTSSLLWSGLLLLFYCFLLFCFVFVSVSVFVSDYRSHLPGCAHIHHVKEDFRATTLLSLGRGQAAMKENSVHRNGRMGLASWASLSLQWGHTGTKTAPLSCSLAG